jgi:tRNA-2-methylthio-N6-dimethylallyladenosine synthase
MNIMKILLKTFGCQMNAYDSQVAAGILEQAGFEVILDNDDTDMWKKRVPNLSPSAPGTGHEVSDGPLRPDIVLMNTCSVREHAEERVWGRLGMLGVEKKERPELIIGLMGCMVEEHREKLFKRFPYLDLMVGTRHIKELPEMIHKVVETRTHVARIKQNGISIEYSEFTKRESGYHAWLPIMTGCDKACTFCVVPKTRGHEVSMPETEVCREARRLVADGVKWITLLGQNVNSYKGGATRNAQRATQNPDVDRCALSVAQETAFPELLEMLCAIDGLDRISYMTSHPSDATEELFQVIARNPKIGRRFHLPLQSGSDRILKRMKRLHTYAEYKTKIDRLRELVPEISITTDIIVGFPSEMDVDHQATWRALEELRFDSAFIYKYSTRPGTPAAKLTDDVPLEVKAARNQELLGLQRKITGEKSRALTGKTFTVFVEGWHVDEKGTSSFLKQKGACPLREFVGRMDQDRRVIFLSQQELAGKFAQLQITGLYHETFLAKLV